MGCHFLLQRIFLTQGLNPSLLQLLHWWWWWFSHQVVSDSCNLMGCSPPGSSVHGILQARALEWVTISFSVSCIGRQIFFYHCTTGEAGDSQEEGSVPGLGRSPRGGQGNPLQHSCPENSTDRVHREADTTERLNRSPHPNPRHCSPR